METEKIKDKDYIVRSYMKSTITTARRFLAEGRELVPQVLFLTREKGPDGKTGVGVFPLMEIWELFKTAEGLPRIRGAVRKAWAVISRDLLKGSELLAVIVIFDAYTHSTADWYRGERGEEGKFGSEAVSVIAGMEGRDIAMVQEYVRGEGLEGPEVVFAPDVRTEVIELQGDEEERSNLNGLWPL